MIKKAIKKPVEIKYVVWTGENRAEVEAFAGNWNTLFYDYYNGTTEPTTKALKIKTLEGWMKAEIGDHIIQGVKGEFYPCKPDIFATTYDIVE